MKFRYHRDKRSSWLSLIYIGLILAAAALILLFAEGTYLVAWLLSLLGAVVILFVLSIPRYVKVDAEALEIHCVVEMTRIEIRDISSIRKIKKKELDRMFILLGSYGFFGYYGYYFDLRDWETVKVYATEWDNLIEIEDIYEQRYIISCRRANKLINTVMAAKLIAPVEESWDGVD